MSSVLQPYCFDYLSLPTLLHFSLQRKDQAVSLHQEYLLRKNELLHSIRNLEEDNKRIIMNEHKYFIRDRSVDRHTFRDQLRQAIADIRADYEFKRLKNEEEIRVRTESEIRRIQASTGGNITRDRLKEELLIVKSNCNGLQQQVSNTEIRVSANLQFCALEPIFNYRMPHWLNKLKFSAWNSLRIIKPLKSVSTSRLRRLRSWESSALLLAWSLRNSAIWIL